MQSRIIHLPQPENNDVFGEGEKFGYCALRNKKETLPPPEDALAWEVLTIKDLTPENDAKPLPPHVLSQRLWTTCKILDEQALEAGATVSATVFDGADNLITATLGDSNTFLVIYNQKDKVIGVIRLNSVTHNPTKENPAEIKRIIDLGKLIENNRIVGTKINCAVSRAIGDHELKDSGSCSDATIDITNIANIAQQLRIARENIGKIQIIATSDGFTDAAGKSKQNKAEHQTYLVKTLKHVLKQTPSLANNECALAQALAQLAKILGSQDDISVAIQTIYFKGKTHPLLY